LGASKIDAGIPLHQEATELQNAPHHLGCERESPFLGESCQTCCFVVEHGSSIGYLTSEVLTGEAVGPHRNGTHGAPAPVVIFLVPNNSMPHYLTD
jgi:hypothetical protein